MEKLPNISEKMWKRIDAALAKDHPFSAVQVLREHGFSIEQSKTIVGKRFRTHFPSLWARHKHL